MRIAFFLLATVVGAPAALAADYAIRVSDGDSIERIAKHFYGATWKSIYLVTRNNLASGKDPKPGDKLVIPACWTYAVRRGESLGTIAKRYLGDKDRFKAVAQANGLRENASLEVGQKLLMPFHLHYTGAEGDSWSSLARRYYRSTGYSGLLKEYNGTDTIQPGRDIVIPIFDSAALNVDTRGPLPKRDAGKSASKAAPGKSSDAPSQLAKATDSAPAPNAGSHSSGWSGTTTDLEALNDAGSGASPPEARTRLRNAMTAYRNGEFDEACPELEGLLKDLQLRGSDRIDLISHLGFCAVANGDLDAARDYFRKWLELAPNIQLDPVRTSPKILAVFEELQDGVAAGKGRGN